MEKREIVKETVINFEKALFLLTDCRPGLSLGTDPSGCSQAAQQSCSCPCRTIWPCAEPAPPVTLFGCALLSCCRH